MKRTEVARNWEANAGDQDAACAGCDIHRDGLNNRFHRIFEELVAMGAGAGPCFMTRSSPAIRTQFLYGVCGSGVVLPIEQAPIGTTRRTSVVIICTPA